ncbi:MAG: type II secretion system secretin GspD [Burkholderiales bacterium]|nr:type II secretion system secretin GspD [Burkholderiales bacterium]
MAPPRDPPSSVLRRLRPTGLLAAFVLAAAILASPVARAADEPVTLNFTNADIEAVVKAVAEITGKSFIVDPRVKGNVTIVSVRPVPRALVYPTLMSALRMQGITAIEADNVVRIVPEAEARLQAGPVGSGAVTAAGSRLVTQVIPLRYESAAQLVNVLRPLITPANTIAAFPGGNALGITDYADNLKRLEKVIASLDQPPGGEPMVVPLRHASAIDLVPTLQRLLADPAAPGGAAADAQQRLTLVGDARSNSVIIRAENPGRAARARQLIEQLDTPGRPGGNMFIVYLKNAEAARVVQTLRALLTGQESGASTAPPPPAATPASGSAMTSTSVASQTPLPFAPPSTGTSFTAGGATISADATNNALVILAPEPVYNNLRAVIEKLDVRRAQVYVEALIAEVSADKAAEFGIQWQVLNGVNSTQTRVVGGTNFGQRGSGNNIIDISANLGSAAQGLNLGVIRGTVNIPGLGVIQNLGFLARALETQVNANILSTPTLLTLDNEEARIVVGQNVPFVTGQYAQTGSSTTVTPFQTIERRDVGLVLRVRPQITEGGTVRLVLYQEVSRIQDASNATGIILSKRSLESSVVIDDSQIVVLGGLIEDRLTDGTDKVPVMGDVPVLGQLFRYDARKREKTNLMIFLKPTIVRTGADGREFTSERYQYLQSEQQRMDPGPRAFWNDPLTPTLPPEGRMPGQPGASTPGPPSPPPPIPPWTEPAPSPPFVRPQEPPK